MKDNRIMLQPGPVFLPDRVRTAMARQMVERRSTDAKKLTQEVIDGLKGIFKTEQDVLIFSASGTGGLELALLNTLSPGDKVLSLSCGVFGNRFAEIAATHGLQVIKEEVPWGEAVNIERVKEILVNDIHREIKAFLITHSETSTGVLNDLQTIAKLAGEHGALSLVDAVSSLGGADVRFDEWELDIVVAASQKALMSPPGLTMVGISERAWQAAEKSQFTKYYWDLRWNKKCYYDQKLTPYTAPVATMNGLKEALDMVYEEGYENVLERHKIVTKALRAGIKAMDLELFVEDKWASPTVTTVKFPTGIDNTSFRQVLRNKYGVSVAGGLGKIEKNTFRIGHMGYIGRAQIMAGLSGMELAFKEFGHPVEIGAGLKAAQEVFAGAGI